MEMPPTFRASHYHFFLILRSIAEVFENEENPFFIVSQALPLPHIYWSEWHLKMKYFLFKLRALFLTFSSSKVSRKWIVENREILLEAIFTFSLSFWFFAL